MNPALIKFLTDVAFRWVAADLLSIGEVQLHSYTAGSVKDREVWSTPHKIVLDKKQTRRYHNFLKGSIGVWLKYQQNQPHAYALIHLKTYHANAKECKYDEPWDIRAAVLLQRFPFTFTLPRHK